MLRELLPQIHRPLLPLSLLSHNCLVEKALALPPLLETASLHHDPHLGDSAAASHEANDAGTLGPGDSAQECPDAVSDCNRISREFFRVENGRKTAIRTLGKHARSKRVLNASLGGRLCLESHLQVSASRINCSRSRSVLFDDRLYWVSDEKSREDLVESRLPRLPSEAVEIHSQSSASCL